MKHIQALPLFLILMLTACKEEESGSPGDSGTITPGHAGPVEHIDAAERLAATNLETSRDPIDKEIKVFKAEVRGAFDEERFEELDKQASEQRTSRPVFDNGSEKLFQFYEGLSNRFHTGEDGHLTDFAKYERWLKKHPDSLAAHIGLADLWVDYAWFARGSGYADTVSDAQWQAFRQRLEQAGETLGKAAKLPESDPYWYCVALTVGLGQGWSADVFNQVTSEGNKLAPTFWSIDNKRAHTLLPRWFGEEGDWEAYADKVSKRKDGLGAEAYARIVMQLSTFYADVFRDSDASWEITREGLLILRKKYPKSIYIHNCLAYYAVLGRDRDLAKATFEELGDEYDEEVWEEPERYVHFRTWAQTGKW
ncbi:DUF4034 domain-containing protein [Haloferula chungangensis]|uniref:DUF4034 domain-containing protein n=1 Tax=Haloferula chungangensis TaxID=1048331 RepID=A0ABW2L5B7_9BACT